MKSMKIGTSKSMFQICCSPTFARNQKMNKMLDDSQVMRCDTLQPRIPTHHSTSACTVFKNLPLPSVIFCVASAPSEIVEALADMLRPSGAAQTVRRRLRRQWLTCYDPVVRRRFMVGIFAVITSLVLSVWVVMQIQDHSSDEEGHPSVLFGTERAVYLIVGVAPHTRIITITN